MSASSTLLDALTMRLQEQRTLLTAQLRQRLHQSDDQNEIALTNYFALQDDAAESSQLNDIDIATVDHDLAELMEVDAALRRIASGQFGLCEHCGAAISMERLQAQPSARRCLPCQKTSEQSRYTSRPGSSM